MCSMPMANSRRSIFCDAMARPTSSGAKASGKTASGRISILSLHPHALDNKLAEINATLRRRLGVQAPRHQSEIADELLVSGFARRLTQPQDVRRMEGREHFR